MIESCGDSPARNDDGGLAQHVVDPGGVDGADRLVAVDLKDHAEPAVGEQQAGGIVGRARMAGQRMPLREHKWVPWSRITSSEPPPLIR